MAAMLLRRMLMPPWIYLRGLAIFTFIGKPAAFILGHSYSHGVWFYFPVLFLLKSPLALGWTPWLRQPNKTLFAVRCKLLDRQEYCTAF